MLSALDPEASSDATGLDGSMGRHRFLGQIEATQGTGLIWVRGNGVTVRADMEGAKIYLLPAPGERAPGPKDLLEQRFPEEMPRRRTWRQVTSLPEGTRIYLDGSLERRGNMMVFHGSKEDPLLAILHEGEFVIPRAVWSGRHKNEYWNLFTPWALLLGSLSLFILATAAFRSPYPRDTARLLLAGALGPLVPLMPPGVVFFLGYLTTWRRGRFLRAERDLLGLGAFLRAADASNMLIGWGEGLPTDTAPLIRSCRRRALGAEILSAAAFGVGFIVNFALLLLLFGVLT